MLNRLMIYFLFRVWFYGLRHVQKICTQIFIEILLSILIYYHIGVTIDLQLDVELPFSISYLYDVNFLHAFLLAHNERKIMVVLDVFCKGHECHICCPTRSLHVFPLGSFPHSPRSPNHCSIGQ
jgi:hypothetical protein